MSDVGPHVLESFRALVGETDPPARCYAEGAVLLASGAAALAAERFEAALAAGETPFYLKMAHGACAAWLAAGRPDRAEPVARALVAERPDLLTPHRLLGRCLLASERPDEALAVLREALELDGPPEDLARVIADGAVALDRLGRYAEGERWCRHGLARLPEPHPALLLNLATFGFRQGALATARDALRQARDAAPEAAAQVDAVWAAHGDGSPL